MSCSTLTIPSRVTARIASGSWKTSAAGEHRGREEAVVVAGPDLDVELGVVEAEQELDRGRHHDEVAEGDAGEEEDRGGEQDRQDDPTLAVAEGGQHIGVALVEQDRQREDQGAVGGDGESRREGLGDSEGEQFLVVAGQRPGGDFQQQVVLPEAEGQGDAEDDQADDYARAQLVEVLDQA